MNKKTTKDAYPLSSLPDEVQDQLAGSTISSTLDLQSGYWQKPVQSSPGEDSILPKSRNGAVPVPSHAIWPHRCPKLIPEIDGLPFITHYIDDILIHSATEKMHREHLRTVFKQLKKLGLASEAGNAVLGYHQCLSNL